MGQGFIYTVGFIASCVCCVARQMLPPGQKRQHRFKLECPPRHQVSCQKVHGSRIPTKSSDLFLNSRCVHLSHSTGRPLSGYSGASVSSLAPNVHGQHGSLIESSHVTVKDRVLQDMPLTSEEDLGFFRALSQTKHKNPVTKIQRVLNYNQSIYPPCFTILVHLCSLPQNTVHLAFHPTITNKISLTCGSASPV